MIEDEQKEDDFSSLMGTVASIVEAVLAGQAVILSPQHLNPWKAAHREKMVREQWRRSLGWNRV